MEHRLDTMLDQIPTPFDEWDEFTIARSRLYHVIGKEATDRIVARFPKGMGLAAKTRALNIKRADAQELPY